MRITMYKVKKNDKALIELKALANKSGLSVRDLILSEDYLNNVCDIFYSHMPKLVRMAMNKEKFIKFYSEHKLQFADSIQV